MLECLFLWFIVRPTATRRGPSILARGPESEEKQELVPNSVLVKTQAKFQGGGWSSFH